ncbi:hypothetical protein QZH41_015512, partial [Actinostola sp. cb2023]
MAEMRPSGSQQDQVPWVPPCAQSVQAGVWCEKCNNRLVELKRQVLRLILPEIQSFFHSGTTPNAGSLSSRIFNQIRLPDAHLKSWQADQCQVCSTHLNQLKWEAVSMVHTLEESQFLAYYNIPGYVVGPNADHVLRRLERQRPPSVTVAAEQGDRGLVYARPEDATAAPSFFHRAAQKLNLSSKKKCKRTHKESPQPTVPQETAQVRQVKPKDPSPYPFPTKFKEVLRSSSPTVPAALQKTSPKRTDGKVKVMLRICPSFIGESASVLKVDTKRKQITLYDPSTATHVSTAKRKMGVAAPKIFAFDAIYEPDAKQSDVCSGTLVDILQTVVGGCDACVFTYGHVGLGKTYSMIGRDESDQTIGILPSALSWLFRLISEQKQRRVTLAHTATVILAAETGTKFSVRVSAVEIVGRSENWRDLLVSATTGTDNGSNETPSPSEFLRDDRTEGVQLMNPSELRASSAEKAAFYLDAALAARTRSTSEKSPDGLEKDETRNSHMFFTVHIYQVEKHSKNSKEMILWGEGYVRKTIEIRGSKITRMLQESIGNPSCRTTMMAHVSPSLPFYNETLAIAQLASRLHRLRKRKGKGSGTSSSGGESSCDESRIRKPRLRTAEPKLRTTAIPDRLRENCAQGEGDNSDQNSSTGEESCDTVIYVGPDGELSDRDLTDHEGPPSLHHYKPLSKNISPWEDCETTRSLKRKLEAIENLDQEDEEEADGKVTQTPVEKIDEELKEVQEGEIIVADEREEEAVQELTEPTDVIEVKEERQPSPEISVSTTSNIIQTLEPTIETPPQIVEHKQDIDTFDDDYFEELQELEFLEETLDKNLASDEEFEFQEKDFLPNFTEQPTFLQDDLSFLPKGQELTERELRETAKYALSKTESLLDVEPDNIAALEDWNEYSVDVAAIMRYHKATSRPTPVDQPKGNKKGLTSQSSSSDASSSDAESIVLPEKPCFSFMTCDAVNEDVDNAGKKPTKRNPRHSGSFIVTNAAGDVKCSYEVTAQLVEACQPERFFSEEGCFVFEEQQSPDEFYYDDTELIWGEKEDDMATVTVLYSDERGQGIEKTLSRVLSEELLFPDLDQKLDNVNPVDDIQDLVSELSIKLTDGSSDSDQELPPRSPAMDTPMKLFYHLVPSPHSSSNEDLDEGQLVKVIAMTAKSLSPIQECPSRESSLNRSSESITHELRDQNFNVIETDVTNYIKAEAIGERDMTSPPSKYFRTVEHEQMSETLDEGERKKASPQKHEFSSLLQKFVAEQLMECQGMNGELKISRPQPRPAVPAECVTPTRGSRRCRVISPNDTANQDILLPPLQPHRRSMLDKARVIRSPKLDAQRDREYGSDVVSYRRDYHDDSSDSSHTARTEPWSPIRPRPLFPTPPQRPNITTNVTFLGCETPSPASNTKVMPIDNDIEETRAEEEEACVDDEFQETRSKRKQERYQEYGYQSEPEARKNRNGRHRRKRDERGYVSESECKVKNKENNSDSFVRLTYCGSEVSGSEAEIRRPRLHQSEPHVGRYGNLKRPTISREKINPKTPYAPQYDFKVRHQHRRSLHKIIYRLSGEIAAVVTTAQGPIHYAKPIDGTRGSGSMSLSVDAINSSPNPRLGSTSTVNSSGMVLGESTSTVWVLSEPAMSSEEMTADERSVPGTPVSVPRGRGLSRLRLFSRDRGSSYSSGHASDSSVNDSPGPRQSRVKDLRRSKSASTRSDAASSSGYESMRNDTSHASSDSCSDKDSSKKKKKRDLRKRSSSAPPSNRRRSRSPRRWFSRKSLNDHVEIKVYHVDDIDKLQKFMRSEANEESNIKLHGLKEHQSVLKAELRRSRQRLIDNEQRWSYG